ncbi:CYTH domain-containing protein [Fictibacillus phosphorivorans]|uniref:CYTH domain-containing protein n=1 Tax=Fictibacillus phosphorivorans TaxID=1221500 RepID=UPI00203A4BD6|nr:CYTH domain-containing protein [Fictibacillus phosphorivorans]MCM3776751.1 CYTH domain-containing protein [Fictibacillus phosphorivorans]
MSQEIEIEFKNLITYEEFLQLIDAFKVQKTDFVEQTNYYFDTEDFQLKNYKCALRIRYKKDTYTLTLKQQFDEHILETHQTIEKDAFPGLINGMTLPEGEVTKKLQSLGIHTENIKYLGELTTHRVEFPYQRGLLVLDENHYLGHIDYELEYESADYKKGQQIFQELLKVKNIPDRETKSKIHRFFAKKMSLK